MSYGKGMYLRTLSVKNFRSCLDTTALFQPDLTILVGENNSGKSNVIDAIRLATTPSGRRTRYFETDDVCRYRSSDQVSIEARYADITPGQEGIFSSSLDMNKTEIVQGVGVDVSKEPLRPSLTSGPIGASDTEQSLRDGIRHVYLAPLRDAQKELDSPEGGRLLAILDILLTSDEKAQLLKDGNEKLKALENDAKITGPVTKISTHVENLTKPVRQQSIGAKFSEMELRQLVRNIRLKMAESGFDVCSLADSGLGYANLLFISSVLLELQSVRDAELTIFLVEEPEAHLHPQLQTVLLEYLREQAVQSLKAGDKDYVGRIQVICTTHSPQLASGVPIENVTVLKSSASTGTRAIAVAELNLPKEQLNKITRYLDATKANLLFSPNVILVEGLAEVLLFPSLARLYLREKGLPERLASGITVVGIGGVDFDPYVRLLMTKAPSGIRIAEKLIVVTDSDPLGDDLDQIAPRITSLPALVESLDGQDGFFLQFSKFTLEADLLDVKENGPIMRSCYLDQHKLSASKWDDIANDAEPAKALYKKLSDKSFLHKGEFAQSLSKRLDQKETFEIPKYLIDALGQVLSQE